MPELIALVRRAVKANAFTKHMSDDFAAMGSQIQEDENNIASRLTKDDEAHLTEIYKEGVWKTSKVKRSGGGGIYSPIY